MAKVYVITMGSYSDYHICAGALDREKAERLCEVLPSWCGDVPEIEEWDTEANADLLAGRKPYVVQFLENGDVYSAFERTWCIELFKQYIEKTQILSAHKPINVLEVSLYAENKASAIKIAAERRAKYLAEKEGIA